MMDGKKILIVEDESIIAEDIRRTLLNKGYDVPSVVSSGEAAIDRVREDKPDLILMDIMLSGKIDGIETFDRIRAKYNIPVVYLTAYCDEKILGRAKITEPFGYIVKPFKDRELYITVEMALYKHKMEMKIRRNKEFFEGILEGIVTGVWVSDKNDVILYANKGMKSTIARQLVGVQVHKVFQEPFKQYYIRSKETLEPFSYKAVPFIFSDTETKYHSGWLIPRIRDGKFNGMICTIETIHTQIE